MSDDNILISNSKDLYWDIVLAVFVQEGEVSMGPICWG